MNSIVYCHPSLNKAVLSTDTSSYNEPKFPLAKCPTLFLFATSPLVSNQKPKTVLPRGATDLIYLSANDLLRERERDETTYTIVCSFIRVPPRARPDLCASRSTLSRGWISGLMRFSRPRRFGFRHAGRQWWRQKCCAVVLFSRL